MVAFLASMGHIGSDRAPTVALKKEKLREALKTLNQKVIIKMQYILIYLGLKTISAPLTPYIIQFCGW